MKNPSALLFALVAIFAGGCDSPPDSSAPQQAKYVSGIYYISGSEKNPGAGVVGAPFDTLRLHAVTNARYMEYGRATLVAGRLPPGLYLNGSDAITGVPTLPGDYTCTVKVLDVLADGIDFGTRTTVVRIVITGS